MKLVLGLVVLSAMAASAFPAQAQAPPPGSYQRQCRDIRMEGQFLHASCRGAHGWAVSSINVLSCSTNIGVDVEGGLICGGPGGGAAPTPYPQPYPAPEAYPPNTRPWPPPGGGGGYDRWSVTIYDRFGWRGNAIRLRDEMPNLDRTGLNDRVASIRLGRRTGPWLVCSDANYRGRCVTIDSDIPDTRQLGMLNSISSMRPLRDERPYPQPR
jgi:hypothetical protein